MLAPKPREQRRFQLVLIKPSHYDADGYVIQWARSSIPSNSLASVYALAMDAAERDALGIDIDIDISDDGVVTIASTNSEGMAEAKKRIEQITAEIEVGQVYEGTVLKLLDFGAIVNLLPGKDGLLHISEIVNERVKDINDYLKEGQQVKVKVIQTDEKGRVRLSAKALLNEAAAASQSDTPPQQ